MSDFANSLPTENTVVYFDFDNTITDHDVLDSVIEKFATGTEWKDAETEWAAGRMGARDCLDIQMRSLRVTPDELSAFLQPIQIDPAFAKTSQWLRARGIEHSILSDNFTEIITRILVNNHLSDVPVYANTMRFNDDGHSINPSFPFFDDNCPRCAHCKKVHLLERPDSFIVYVGDGRSDICPALIADRVYARSFLLEHLTELGHDPIPFTNIADVLQDLQLVLHPTGIPERQQA